jgi:penicillin-binding protein 2
MLPLRWRKRKRAREIEPDEILIDSTNPAEFDTDQFEGRMERPLPRRTHLVAMGLMVALMGIYAAQALNLQIVKGATYAKQAAENKLEETIVFADRGLITDRSGTELAFNVRASAEDEFAERVYAPYRGLAHVVGYAKAPTKDASGNYYRTSFVGIEGVEKIYNDALSGKNGTRLTETDAKGAVVSESAQRPPTTGATVGLSLDAEVTQALYDAIAKRAEESKFQGGASVIMDVTTGEVLAMTNYPEYAPQDMLYGRQEAIDTLLNDSRQPFLNRAISGLYAPGSIVKPVVAIAALSEGIISEQKQILSTGSISIPNPYDPSKPSIFKDWRAHGLVDMRRALAVSSDVYFYAIGGGYKDQKGLGILTLDRYLQFFGMGKATGIAGFGEPAGTIPTPEWKEKTFDGDPWRLGDTYNTSIGQYGVQVTPLQMARMTAALASNGKLFTPTIIGSSTPVFEQLPFTAHTFDVVHEGMRMAVTEGTAAALNVPFVEVAGKTGTAQVGARNEYMNSWIIGFFPYDKPRYAFATVLERAPAGTATGAPAAMNEFLWWLHQNKPEYLATSQ